MIKRATGIRRYISPEKRNRTKKLLRALFNARLPLPISGDFLRVQDEYLQEEITEKDITSTDDLEPVKPDIYLWQGVQQCM